MQAGLRRLPVQSPAEDWQPSTEPGIWRTPQHRTISTTKEKQFQVVVQESQYHAADVREVTNDVRTGEFTTVKFTSSLPLSQKMAMINRLARLREAVQMAVHDANRAEVTDQHVGEGILGYVFGTNGSVSK